MQRGFSANNFFLPLQGISAPLFFNPRANLAAKKYITLVALFCPARSLPNSFLASLLYRVPSA